LRPWLSGNPIDVTQADVSERIGVSLEVVKKTVQRWRTRFRTIVKSLIAATVDSPFEIDQELSYLVESLSLFRFTEDFGA
jgi:hypothetical protein